MRLLLTLVLLLVATTPAASQQPKQPESNEKTVPYTYRGTEQAPFIVKSIPEEKTPDQIVAEKEKAKLDRKTVQLTSDLVNYTFLLFVATGVLAFGTTGLAVVAYCQMKEARTSIHAAKRAADTAESALVDIERAFVFLRGFAQAPQIAHDGGVREWAIIPVLHNSGATHTRQMIVHANSEIRDDELPDDFDFPDKWPDGEEKRHYVTFVGPKVDLNMAGLGFHIIDLSKINSGEKKIYVYGWMEYNDVFPNTPRHRTEFCSQIVKVGDVNSRVGAPIALQIYKKHNGAENDCLKKAMSFEARIAERP